MKNAIKWSPSVVPGIIAIITMFSPEIQAWMAERPDIMTALGAIVMIINHVLNPPQKKTVEPKETHENQAQAQEADAVSNHDGGGSPLN